jgi:hypothetical protein
MPEGERRAAIGAASWGAAMIDTERLFDSLNQASEFTVQGAPGPSRRRLGDAAGRWSSAGRGAGRVQVDERGEPRRQITRREGTREQG